MNENLESKETKVPSPSMGELNIQEILKKEKEDYRLRNNASMMVVSFEIGHSVTNRAVKRQYPSLSRNSFLVGRFCDYIGDVHLAEQTDEHISNAFQKTLDLINVKTEQLNILMASENIENTAEFAQKRSYKDAICSPFTKRYINILKKADNLLLLIDSAWLNDVMDTRSKITAQKEIRDKVYTLERTVTNLKSSLLSRLNEKEALRAKRLSERKKGGSSKSTDTKTGVEAVEALPVAGEQKIAA